MTINKVYGWQTVKIAEGKFRWNVTLFVYGEGTTLVQSGVCDTRAKAMLRAKRHVLPLRRAAQIDAGV